MSSGNISNYLGSLIADKVINDLTSEQKQVLLAEGVKLVFHSYDGKKLINDALQAQTSSVVGVFFQTTQGQELATRLTRSILEQLEPELPRIVASLITLVLDKGLHRALSSINW